MSDKVIYVPRTSRLATASLILFLLLGPFALPIAIAALVSIYKSNGRLTGKWRSIAVVFLSSLFLLATIPWWMYQVNMYHRLNCAANLKTISQAINTYTSENNGKFPNPENWCDILISEYGMTEKDFKCPAAKEKSCNYAMNSNISKYKGKLPADLVLLFESTPGWNQVGGPKLLSTNNHKPNEERSDLNGCYVLYTDGYIEFIRAKDLDELKWTIDQEQK